MKKLMILLVASATLMVSSCSKTGPQGPQGPQGNANVVGEDPFTVSTWLLDAGSNTYYATFSDQNITSAVAAHGMVEIYKLYPSSGWTNLPDIDGLTTTVYNFGYTTGSGGGFTISILRTDGALPNNPGSVEFRAVVIPSSLRIAYPNANWKNYNETMAILNKEKMKTGSSVSAQQ